MADDAERGEVDDIIVAADLPESSLTVAEAVRRDGGIILPDDRDDDARDRTLAEYAND